MRRFRSGLAGPQDAQGMAAPVFKRLDRGGNFQDAIADGVQAVRLVSLGEEFGFHDAGPIGDGDEFHRFTGDLVEEALFDDQAARDDFFAKMLTQAVDRAVGVPGDIGEELKRVAAHRVAEEFFLGPETVEAGGFDQGDGGEAVEVGGREKPGLE